MILTPTGFGNNHERYFGSWKWRNNLFEPEFDELENNTFVLVNIIGGERFKTRNTCVYKIDEFAWNDLEVKSQIMVESDKFTISRTQIKAILPNPVEEKTGRKLAYLFSSDVNVKKGLFSTTIQNFTPKYHLPLLCISEIRLQLFSGAANVKKSVLTRLLKHLHQKMRLTLLFISEFWTCAITLPWSFFFFLLKKNVSALSDGHF